MRRTPADPELGEYRPVKVRDLVVLSHLQRIAPDSRIRKMAAEWDDEKASHLKVGHILDGPNKGVLHVYDGGTRAMCRGVDIISKGHRHNMADKLPAGAFDPDYMFKCVIDPMTEVEAARQFHVCNGLARKPGKLQEYRVGLIAGEVDALAVEHGLSLVGLIAETTSATYGNGEPGNVGAIAACYRVVEDGKRAAASAGITDIAEQWEHGSALLADSLRLSRQAFQNADGHDADIIQAVARLLRFNDMLSNPSNPKYVQTRQRLSSTLGSAAVAAWRSQSIMARDQATTYGGSASRSIHMARVIAERVNKAYRARASSRLVADA